MNELKLRVMEIIDCVNQDWVNSLKEAEKTKQGVDLTEIMGKFSKNIVKLDGFFKEAEERVGKKKKGIFG